MKINTPKLIGDALRSAKKNRTAAIIVAAGNSTRMGGKGNKQFALLDGIPVLAHTLMAYQSCVLIREIVVVARPQDFDTVYAMRREYGITKMTHIVSGGKTRQESVRHGMQKISEEIKFIAIADGARCLTKPMQIAQVCLAAYRAKAASAGHKVSDTVKRTTALDMTVETVDRNRLWLAQTPQVFHKALYIAALHNASKDKLEATDDNALVEHLGYRVRMVECGMQNMKITTQEDLPVAQAILLSRKVGEETGEAE